MDERQRQIRDEQVAMSRSRARFVAKSIAFNAAHQRIGESEGFVTDPDSAHKAAEAATAKLMVQCPEWHTIEIVLERKENMR
ncbi:hypothetical protein IVB12_15720 [Bradyrhizobium sp. 179]|uniref:hypothetical protein n=1 Tax=Bradyrhizobium sp. 179 TaxID=2782648 RepID=UPI001FF741DC|nr:hypothetical protein [Bradyrhizobium sp. 179]MCK1543364.1 hypothetical protein [Bradyrhizobium sp. 179]